MVANWCLVQILVAFRFGLPCGMSISNMENGVICVTQSTARLRTAAIQFLCRSAWVLIGTRYNQAEYHNCNIIGCARLAMFSYPVTNYAQ